MSSEQPEWPQKEGPNPGNFYKPWQHLREIDGSKVLMFQAKDARASRAIEEALVRIRPDRKSSVDSQEA